MKIRQQKVKASFWMGVIFTLIGIVVVAFVQPHVDYNRGIYAEAPGEFWLTGALSLLVGIGFIVYSFIVRARKSELEREVYSHE